MKKNFARIVSIFLILLLIKVNFSTEYVFASAGFSDISGVESRESIVFLAQRGLVEGYSDGTFQPFKTVTRAELVKLLVQANFDESAVGAGTDCFLDVRDEWFARYVCFGKEEEFVTGYGSGKLFKPGGEVKISEGLALSMRIFQIMVPTAKKSEQWYVPYVTFAHTNNIFSKFSYVPGVSMNRQQMAFLMHQLILIKEGKKQPTDVRNSRSSGCGKIPPKVAPTKITIGGIDRNYITVIPRDYEKNTPKKLVFAFHGRTNSNEMVRGYYKVEQAAGNEAIFIYPAGLRSGGGYSWSSPGDPPYALRDFKLFDELLWQFADTYCIDMDHVYVVGHSLGAWFTNSLACNRGNVIRAIGSLGGGTSWGNCNGPVAAMVWHNPKDSLVGFNQGERARDQVLNQNQCSNERHDVEPRAGNCVRYIGCDAYAPVLWCPHTIDYAEWDNSYYTHNWPAITGPAIWEFFENLPD